MEAEGRRSEAPDVCPPLRRKSDRLSATENTERSVPVKRSIVLKKIEPQKNVLKPISGAPQRDPRLTTCIATAPRRSPRISPKAMKENVGEGSVRSDSGPSTDAGWVRNLPSASTPATPSTRETGVSPDTAPAFPGDRGTGMPQKVRRSYSRLSPFGIHASNTSVGSAGRSFGGSPRSPSDGSDTSTPNQPLSASRRSFFGFERLLASEALLGVSPVKPSTPREKRAKLLAQATPAAASHAPRDVNIPGVAVAKEKRKKRKIPQIEKVALDDWAAQMNATFEEAERFDLLVE